MRSIFLCGVIAVVGAANAAGQTTSKPTVDPKFPAEASNIIYGDKIPVIVQVDANGKVTKAITLGPHVPCSNPNDKIATAIGNAAVEAAKATAFDPVLKDGKPTEVAFMITYDLPSTERVLRDDKNGPKDAREMPKPDFPQSARQRNIQGGAAVSVLIDQSGKILSAAPRSGPEELIPAAIRAACNSKFNPRPEKLLTILRYVWKI